MIYISGGSGFIGKHLIEALGDREHYIIPHQDLTRVKYENFDTFFYLSGYGNHSQQTDIAETVSANVCQLTRVLEKIKNKRFKNFIHASTSSVTLRTRTVYSDTKSWGEYIVSYYAKKTNKAYCSARLYSIFGSGEADFRFIPTMCRNLVSGITPTIDPFPVHDWVGVWDAVDALLLLSDKVVSYIPPQGIGYGYPTTNLQVYRDIKKILGVPNKVGYERIAKMRAYDIPNSWYKRKPDYLDEIWEPKMGYWESLKKTVEYYKQKYA